MPGFNYSDVTDLKWANEGHTFLNCLVTFTDHPQLEGPQPFTAAESDPGWGHSEEIFARAVAGDFGPIADYEPPEIVASPRASLTCVARISGITPAGVIDGAGIMSVTRISAGRYRLTHAETQPDTRYSVIATAEDNAVRNVRSFSRTTTWIELRSTDSTGAAADAREICLQISRAEL